jgi:hypothetical protein
MANPEMHLGVRNALGGEGPQTAKGGRHLFADWEHSPVCRF